MGRGEGATAPQAGAQRRSGADEVRGAATSEHILFGPGLEFAAARRARSPKRFSITLPQVPEELDLARRALLRGSAEIDFAFSIEAVALINEISRASKSPEHGSFEAPHPATLRRWTQVLRNEVKNDRTHMHLTGAQLLGFKRAAQLFEALIAQINAAHGVSA
jgi:hypothetical protein